MAESDGRSRWGTFVIGGLIGGAAGFAASRLRERPRRARPLAAPGLAAFEQAPCFRELEETEHEAVRRQPESRS